MGLRADNLDAAAARRERIRTALLGLCHERGYPALGLDDVLLRAGVGEEEFHRHFADLEDCFCQIYLEIREDFLARLRAAVSATPAWRERLRAAAYFLLDFFAEDAQVTYFGMVEVRRAGERAQLLFAEVFEAIFDLLDEGRGQLAEPEAISRATAESIAGGIFGRIYLAIGDGETLRAEAVPGMLYAAVLPYLGPAAAQEELRTPPPPAADV